VTTLAFGKGQCPRELEPEDRMTPMNINLVKKETDYEPPPEPKYKAFAGTGRTMVGLYKLTRSLEVLGRVRSSLLTLSWIQA
jgi:hypothetical protein